MNHIPTVVVASFLFYFAHPAFCVGGIGVINGDAEMGDLTGWTGSGAASAATDVLQWQYTVTPRQGDWFFSFARPASTTGELEQTGTMEIGNGPVLRLTGIFQTEFGDAGEAVITLLDADNARVAKQTTRRILTRDHRWETFSVDVSVPPTAASWRINLFGTLNNGQYTNTYFDDIRLGILGDFNRDGELTIHDLETLTSAVQSTDAGEPKLDLDRLQFDLDRSGDVDPSDRQHWITELRQTWIGDANLDGIFGSADLITVFSAGLYEDAVAGNATWSSGDWNGDGEFDSGDLVEAFGDGGYEAGPRVATAAVPEPSTAMLLLIGLTGVLGIRNLK